MIVDVTGFGWSGSGAVTDLLREYREVDSPVNIGDWEFTLLHSVDGVRDLDYKLNKKHCRIYDSDIAINRFLHLCRVLNDNKVFGYYDLYHGKFYQYCEEYIRELTQFSFKGRSFYYERVFANKYDGCIRFINRITGFLFNNRLSLKIFGSSFYNKLFVKRQHEMRVAYNPDNFEKATKQFISLLLKAVRSDERKVLITDQMLPADNPADYLCYFEEEVKCIIVKRDPRDLYVLSKCIYSGNIPIPSHDVNVFIQYYKTIIGTNHVTDSRVMYVNFEDLIYRYEETVLKIQQFIKIEEHADAHLHFKPEVSINNTQLYTKYPYLKNDIMCIENELHDFLYNFDEFDLKPSNIKTSF